jgi:hypothetical protein
VNLEDKVMASVESVQSCRAKERTTAAGYTSLVFAEEISHHTNHFVIPNRVTKNLTTQGPCGAADRGGDGNEGHDKKVWTDFRDAYFIGAT